MKKKKVICVGEALIDRIRNKSNQGFTDFLGGAPANVACALRKLKIEQCVRIHLPTTHAQKD